MSKIEYSGDNGVISRKGEFFENVGSCYTTPRSVRKSDTYNDPLFAALEGDVDELTNKPRRFFDHLLSILEYKRDNDPMIDKDEQKFYFETEYDSDFHELVFIGTKPSDVMRWRANFVPLYSSDYLLTKLPKEIERKDGQYGAKWGMKNLTQMLDGVWSASYRFEDEMNPPEHKYDCEADTPLKALLKLVIALHEANQLPPNNQNLSKGEV